MKFVMKTRAATRTTTRSAGAIRAARRRLSHITTASVSSERPRHVAEQDEDQHAGHRMSRAIRACHATADLHAARCVARESTRVDEQDIILTLGVMLVAGLVCQLVADTSARRGCSCSCSAGRCSGRRSRTRSTYPSDSTGAELPADARRVVHPLLRRAAALRGCAEPRRGRDRAPRGAGRRHHGVRRGHGRLPGVRPPASRRGSLIGAVVAPTDPAILIPLFDRIGIRQKIEQTAIAESALNDATGAVLALVLAGVVESGDASVADPVVDFLTDLGISTVLGIAFGIVLSLVVSDRRAGRVEGVGGDRGRRGRRGRVLLHRLGRRQRLSRRVSRRARRRRHGPPPARNALRPRA